MATLFRSRIRVEESRNLVAHHQRKKNAVVLGGRSEATGKFRLKFRGVSGERGVPLQDVSH